MRDRFQVAFDVQVKKVWKKEHEQLEHEASVSLLPGMKWCRHCLIAFTLQDSPKVSFAYSRARVTRICRSEDNLIRTLPKHETDGIDEHSFINAYGSVIEDRVRCLNNFSLESIPWVPEHCSVSRNERRSYYERQGDWRSVEWRKACSKQ